VVCRGVELFLVWDVSVGYYTYTCLLFIFMVVAVHVVVHSFCLVLFVTWKDCDNLSFCRGECKGHKLMVWLILFVWM
jgi:hypothetical protein